MRLVTWNANNRGRTTGSDSLTEIATDVAVLPEWSQLPMPRPIGASSFVEFGRSAKKGLAVASWGDWSVSAADVQEIDGVVLGAVDIAGPTPFKMIAVWTYLSGTPTVNPLTEALGAWRDWIGSPLVVAGDFNTGCSWRDLTVGPMSHFPLVEQLDELGLHSAYHVANGVEQGIDEAPTHWHNSGRNCMIDHVFTPKDWQLASVAVGDEATWSSRSDHAPVIVDIDLS